MHTSKIILNKTNYRKNIDFIKRLVGKKVLVSSVVKANAYGHGIKEFVPVAEEAGINHFSVFSQNEAFEVKKYCKNNPTIMIMGVVSLKHFDWVVKNDIDFYVFNYTRLLSALKIAKKLNKKLRIHIEVETGLNRTGFAETELQDLFKILKKNKKYIKIKGLCTHFAGAENIANYYRIKKQRKRFKEYISVFKKEGITPELIHAASSAGMITMPETRFNLVRVGVMQYGFWPSGETRMFYFAKKKRKENPLHPILSWESEIMSIKTVNAGDYIGYSNNYQAYDEMKIATVPVGYSQGYSRRLSNNSWVIVNGEFAEVIGIVNMNLFQIDVTHLPEIKIGDKVILIGEDSNKKISFASFSDRKNSLSYDILTRIPEDIPRKVIH